MLLPKLNVPLVARAMHTESAETWQVNHRGNRLATQSADVAPQAARNVASMTDVNGKQRSSQPASSDFCCVKNATLAILSSSPRFSAKVKIAVLPQICLQLPVCRIAETPGCVAGLISAIMARARTSVRASAKDGVFAAEEMGRTWVRDSTSGT